ncbi:hypothetical protein [Streptomyces sp. NPDC005125]
MHLGDGPARAFVRLLLLGGLLLGGGDALPGFGQGVPGAAVGVGQGGAQLVEVGAEVVEGEAGGVGRRGRRGNGCGSGVVSVVFCCSARAGPITA